MALHAVALAQSALVPQLLFIISIAAIFSIKPKALPNVVSLPDPLEFKPLNA